jgi:hypothetical protein
VLQLVVLYVLQLVLYVLQLVLDFYLPYSKEIVGYSVLCCETFVLLPVMEWRKVRRWRGAHDVCGKRWCDKRASCNWAGWY